MTDNEDFDALTNKYKSWGEEFPALKNQFVAKRFSSGGQAILDADSTLGELLSSYFEGKKPVDACEFELTTKSDGTALVKFIDQSNDGFLDAYTEAYPCKLFNECVVALDKNVPVVFVANHMGFIWRADNKPIMEFYEVHSELKLD